MTRSLPSAIIALLLPLLLFFGTLLGVSLAESTYLRCFHEYGAAARTGLSAAELGEVARQFVAHFRHGVPLDLQVQTATGRVPMLDERETVHLWDVHYLLQFGVRAWAAAVSVLLLAVFWGARLWPSFRRGLGGALLAGASLTLALLALVAVVSLVAFDQLFILFHEISFRNDFWLLDPTRHYLINLFDQQFFMDTTLLAALMTAAEALLLASVALLMRRSAVARRTTAN